MELQKKLDIAAKEAEVKEVQSKKTANNPTHSQQTKKSG